MTSHLKLELPEKCRLLAVSDIHTAWQTLDRLLKKAEYDPENDYLVIVGDIVEHRSDNIRTLEYVKALCDNSDKAICLLGNNDTMCARMAYTYGFERFQQQFYRNEHNTFREMANALGYTDCWEGNWQEIRERVVGKYGELLSFMRYLPICLETQEYVFVHAGLENRPDWRNTDDTYAITVPWFFNKENPTDKWLVVGHFPAMNFKASNASCLPAVDERKKMICLDGGIGIKHICQLNMLAISKDGDSYKHDVLWDTFHPMKKAVRTYRTELAPVYTDFDDQDIEILSEDNNICLVTDKVTGEKGYIPKHRVFDWDGINHVYEWLSHCVNVDEGEVVYVCDERNGIAFIIKQDGKAGWLPAEYLEQEK